MKNEPNQKRFSISIDAETDQKISDYKIKKNISQVQVVQEALDFFFEKQNEKEIINAVLQRLDEIKSISKECEVYSFRTNSFLNTSSESSMNPEDYKKLRETVLKDVNTFLSSKGYRK